MRFDIEEILYDLNFNSRRLLAKAIVLELQRLGVSLADFIDAIGIYVDEDLQLTEPAALIQQAHRKLTQTKE